MTNAQLKEEVPKYRVREGDQIDIEYQYAQIHLDNNIRSQISNSPEMVAKIAQGVSLLKAWLAQTYYPQKNARLQQLKGLDLNLLVQEIFVGIAYAIEPVVFSNITAQLACRLLFDSKRNSIITVAEMVAILAQTDAFDIMKKSQYASIELQSCIPLEEKTYGDIRFSLYLPPMISPPREVKSNYQSGHLTFNDSLILGSNNSHDQDICLDVINIQNQVPLELNIALLDSLPETPNHELDSLEKQQLWANFKAESHEIYRHIVTTGNQFWMLNKVCSRGRLYACGYHVNPQGTSYKKAIVQLADKEVVTGVPKEVEP